MQAKGCDSVEIGFPLFYSSSTVLKRSEGGLRLQWSLDQFRMSVKRIFYSPCGIVCSMCWDTKVC